MAVEVNHASDLNRYQVKQLCCVKEQNKSSDIEKQPPSETANIAIHSLKRGGIVQNQREHHNKQNMDRHC